MYLSNSGETSSYLSNFTPFELLFVEDAPMLQMILAGRTPKEAFPTVKKIVLMAPGSDASSLGLDNVLTWADLRKAAESVPESQLDEIESSQCVNEACVVLFTSGTTGMPKGAMLSHDNLAYAIALIGDSWLWGRETIVTCLPLNHIAAFLLDVLMQLHHGGTTYCADKNALKGTLVWNQEMSRVRTTLWTLCIHRWRL